MRIAVAGATGVVGRYVVEAAAAAGHEVVPLARSTGVDVVSGAGLTDRLTGVDAVVDVLNIATQRRSVAEEFFTTTSQHLLDAGAAAGVGHHVTLSIIGVDLVPTGYYHGKLAQEAAVAAGSVPWSVLRAAQFHEFAEQALGFVRIGPLSVVPRMLSQPVSAREVGAALVDLAAGEPVGHAPELAGPDPLQIVDLARRVNDVRRLGRRVVGVRLPGRAGRAMSTGALLPREAGPRGTVTFEEWLTA